MITNDSLWKGAIEDLLPDFLRYFYPDETFQRGKVEFLDKELEEIFPLVDGRHKRRRVDKLIKLFTTGGKEQWILIHIEVQGYKDQDLQLRMFQYFYRILDRYKMPVSALVILTDSNPGYNPSVYRYTFLDSKLEYQYRTFKVIDQNEEDLDRSNNPFATVILTTLEAIRMKRLPDLEKLDIRTEMVRQLFKKGYTKKTIRSLLYFIRFYTQSKNRKMNQLFENRVKEITQTNDIMGLEEMIIQQAEEKGMEKGMEKGALLFKTQAVERMLRKGSPIDFICEILDVSPEFVKEVQVKLEEN